MTSQFSDMTSTSNFFDVVLFSCQVQSLVQVLCHYHNWFWNYDNFLYEIRYTPSYTPISGDWSELWIPHLARMSLIEYYSKLQNSRVTAFTVFELRENQLGRGGGKNTPHPPRLGLNWERYHLLHVFLIVFILEEVRRQQQSFAVFLLENAL